MQKLLTTILILLIPFVSLTQSITTLVKLGDENFEIGSYNNAIVYYQLALEKNNNLLGVKYSLAESFRMVKEYERAADLYKDVYRTDPESFVLARFFYGDIMKRKGDYKRAASSFRFFYRKNRLNYELKYYILKSKHEREICKYYEEHPPVFTPSDAHLDLLSSSWSEFNIMVDSDSTLYFSSLEYDTLSKMNKYVLYRSAFNDPLMKRDTVFVDFKYTYHFTNSETPGMYYASRCFLYPSTEGDCTIYYGSIENIADQTAKEIEGEINIEGSNSKHPFYYSDHGVSFLLFASDREGGEGKYDLYKAQLKQNEYWEVNNLGPNVNSPGDEITPYYHKVDSSLFFSSDWHDSYGGLDIFQSYLEGNHCSPPSNLGSKVNSSSDDMYFHLSWFNKTAFFTSNRTGGVESELNCCSDIYRWETDFTLSDSILQRRKKRELLKIENEYIADLATLDGIQLYFHNDMPNPRSTDSTTEESYKTLIEDYLLLKGEYQFSYSEQFNGKEKANAILEIDEFFSDVSEGYDSLRLMINQITWLLDRGLTVELTIESYASPLNTSDYNLRLSQRRLKSVLNYIQSSLEADLSVLLEQKKLIIHENALGDSKANENVSSDLSDKANAIYSPMAARERRIVIRSVKVRKLPND